MFPVSIGADNDIMDSVEEGYVLQEEEGEVRQGLDRHRVVVLGGLSKSDLPPPASRVAKVGFIS